MSTLLSLSEFVGTGWARAIILAALLLGLWVGLRRAGFDLNDRLLTWLGVAIPMLVWLFVVLGVAEGGIFLPGATRPVLPLLCRRRSVAELLNRVHAHEHRRRLDPE